MKQPDETGRRKGLAATMRFRGRKADPIVLLNETDKKINRKNQRFTLIELLIVIAIITTTGCRNHVI